MSAVSVSESELKEAMVLNQRLANRHPQNRDDLVSVGDETLGKLIASGKFDPSRGTFAAYARAYLLRDHRRALVDPLCGIHLPHTVSDYDNDLMRIELDSFETDAPLHKLPVSVDYDHELMELPAGERESLLAMTLEAMEKLPPQDQDLLRKHYVEGFTGAEIAGKLKLPVTTVRFRLDRALRELKRVINPAGSAKVTRSGKRKEFLKSADLSAFPEKHRNIVARYLNNERLKDIARDYDCSEFTISSTIGWIIEKIKKGRAT